MYHIMYGCIAWTARLGVELLERQIRRGWSGARLALLFRVRCYPPNVHEHALVVRPQRRCSESPRPCVRWHCDDCRGVSLDVFLHVF